MSAIKLKLKKNKESRINFKKRKNTLVYHDQFGYQRGYYSFWLSKLLHMRHLQIIGLKLLMPLDDKFEEKYKWNRE